MPETASRDPANLPLEDHPLWPISRSLSGDITTLFVWRSFLGQSSAFVFSCNAQNSHHHFCDRKISSSIAAL